MLAAVNQVLFYHVAPSHLFCRAGHTCNHKTNPYNINLIAENLPKSSVKSLTSYLLCIRMCQSSLQLSIVYLRYVSASQVSVGLEYGNIGEA